MGWNEMSIYAGNKCGSKYASLSFPILFSQQYKRYSQSYNISMSYPMAVTRQESRFNPNALAADGGVGLMQIMPGTASYIAKKTGSSNCYKNYDCNIKFGSWYLGHLYDKFGNNLIYATAGYNAGPGRAHRWQQAFNSLDNRVQIELIPFKITRDYVQKVLTNKIVYDARLNNDGQVDLISYLNKMNTKDSTYIIDDDNNNGDGSLNQ
jgi:soluble lytic murein transglycosylase